MDKQFKRLQFLISRCLSTCSASGSSRQYMKIDSLPQHMGNGASINVNQVSVVVNQLKVDLKECTEIAKELEQYIPSKSLPLAQAVFNFKSSLVIKSLIENKGNRSKTARSLGIQRTTMVAFINKWLPAWREEL